jgi:hypothetical protein
MILIDRIGQLALVMLKDCFSNFLEVVFPLFEDGFPFIQLRIRTLVLYKVSHEAVDALADLSKLILFDALIINYQLLNIRQVVNHPAFQHCQHLSSIMS